MDTNDIDNYLKNLYGTSGQRMYTYTTMSSAANGLVPPMVDTISIPASNGRDTWFWEPTNFLETEQYTDNMATRRPSKKVDNITGVPVEVSEKDVMIAFKKQLKLNIENKEYPSDHINNDIQYYLKHTKDKHFNLGIYKSESIPWLNGARYCPMFGVWDKFDLKHVLMIKDRTIPRKSAIRLSFRSILESPVEALKDNKGGAAIEVGDYLWSFDHMYVGQMRVLFRKIMATSASNKLEWAEVIQNRILTLELDFGKKVRKSSSKGANLFAEEFIAPILATSTYRSSFDTAQKDSRPYDIVIKERVEGLPLGLYRFVRGYEHRRLENTIGKLWVKDGSGNVWRPVIPAGSEVVKRADGTYDLTETTEEGRDPMQDPR